MLDLTRDRNGDSYPEEIKPINRVLSNCYTSTPIEFKHPKSGKEYYFCFDYEDNDSRLNAIIQANMIYEKIRDELGEDAKSSEFRKDLPLWGFEVILYYTNNKPDPEIFRKVKVIDNEELYNKLQKLEIDEFKKQINIQSYQIIQEKIEIEEKCKAWDKNSDWYLPNQSFVKWFNKNDIEILEKNKTIIQIEKDISKSIIKEIAPNSKWGEITIRLEPTLESDIPNIRIKTPDYDKCHHPGQYGFTTKNHPNKTTKVFETLRKFAIVKGRITSEVNNSVTIKQVSMLRTHLSELFGITEPSISNYSKLNGWKCNFSISDKRHEEGGYDDIIHQLNLKNARNQDALSHTVNIDVEPEIEIDPETGEPQM